MSRSDPDAGAPAAGGAGPAATGPACPLPAEPPPRVLLGHGSGGRLSAELLRARFLPRLANPALEALTDAAVVPLGDRRLAVTTDAFVVRPLEFPGGDIGRLAVHGTLNDVAMMGGRPLWLAAAFVLEEGLPLAALDRIVDSMAAAAAEAGVPVVTGDTKVVERGKADGAFVITTGVGEVSESFAPEPRRARRGDAILVSGPVGRHGIAVMAAREGLRFEAEVQSDTAWLGPLVEALRKRCGVAVHALRDATRGGVASSLNEIAAAAGVGVELEAEGVAVPEAVEAACEMLGLDPLYVANEGVLVAFVAPESAEEALAALRSRPTGAEARIAGRAVEAHPGLVTVRTALGGQRVVDLLPGDQLPRIC